MRKRMVNDLSAKLKREDTRVKGLLEEALSNLKTAMSSNRWSYTQEYQLGKLDVAKSILKSSIEEIDACLKLMGSP